MRFESMSDTFRFATSETRKPAPYATPSAALYFGPGAASRSARTSSVVRTTGSFCGCFTSRRWRASSGRSQVVVKKNRSAATVLFMVGGCTRLSR